MGRLKEKLDNIPINTPDHNRWVKTFIVSYIGFNLNPLDLNHHTKKTPKPISPKSKPSYIRKDSGFPHIASSFSVSNRSFSRDVSVMRPFRRLVRGTHGH